MSVKGLILTDNEQLQQKFQQLICHTFQFEAVSYLFAEPLGRGSNKKKKKMEFSIFQWVGGFQGGNF